MGTLGGVSTLQGGHQESRNTYLTIFHQGFGGPLYEPKPGFKEWEVK